VIGRRRRHQAAAAGGEAAGHGVGDGPAQGRYVSALGVVDVLPGLGGDAAIDVHGVERNAAPAELEPILDHLTAEEFASDATVIRQGDVGDRFYLIRAGRAEVVMRDARAEERVARELTAGEYFGEMALLNDSPRTATVRALEPLSLWSLDRRAFDELLLQRLDLRATFTTDCERRHAAQRGLVEVGGNGV